MRSLPLVLLAAVLCTGAAAQERIYKVRLPDGRILFTDSPPPSAEILSEREVQPAPTPPPAAVRRDDKQGGVRKEEARADAVARERTAAIDKAFAAVQAAERDVEAAKQRLEQGRAPLPGEMLGTARGGVRVGPAYQERITGLEKAVADAEQKLTKARADLDAVR